MIGVILIEEKMMHRNIGKWLYLLQNEQFSALIYEVEPNLHFLLLLPFPFSHFPCSLCP